MNSTVVKCVHCGAVVRDAALASCEFCGAAFAASAATPSSSALLADVRKHASYGDWRKLEPSVAGHQSGNVIGVVVGVVAISFAAAWMVQASRMGGSTWLFGLVFIGFALVIVVRTLRGATKLASAKLEHSPARVASKEMHISGSRKSTRTTHFVTLELENGERRVLRAAPHLSAAVVAGDVGLAFLRSDVLLEFKRTASLPRA